MHYLSHKLDTSRKELAHYQVAAGLESPNRRIHGTYTIVYKRNINYFDSYREGGGGGYIHMDTAMYA